MAIGDNIPDIFADLPNSVMRVGTQTGGNPVAIAQYVLDLFEGKDADTELSLTQQGAIDGAPMPNGGPIVDQYLLETGDPSMAITMTVDGALTGGADATDPNEIKAGMAALYLSDITPLFNDMDSGLIGQISTDLGITDNDLVAALQDISTQNMLAAPSSMGIGQGDFSPMPDRLLPTPVLPPPLPVGAGPMGGEVDPTTGSQFMPPPPMSLIEQKRAWEATATGEKNWEQFYDEVYPDVEMPGSPWAEVGSSVLDAIVGGVQREGRTQEEQLAASILHRQQQGVTEPSPPVLVPAADMPGSIDLDEAFEREALGLSPGIPPAPGLEGLGPVDYRVGQESVPIGMPATAPAAIDVAGATEPGAALPPGAIPPFAGIYTDVAPGRAQWQAWMPSVVEGYGMGNVQKAYAPTFTPFFGTYLLSDDFANEAAPQPGVPIGQGFPDYMVEHQPQKLQAQNWSDFEGQYNRLINYARAYEADRDSGRSMHDKVGEGLQQAQNNLMQNMGMATAVQFGTADEKKQFALSTALARYYRGNPVTSNYATRNVEKGLSEIYDRIASQTLTERPGANPLTRFFDYIIDIDPGRFGAGGEGVTYGP
jgi:hypothetical protein